jgi:predicted RNA-binding Zn ribbon-like protein
MMVGMVAIDVPSPGFQCVGRLVLRNENRKWFIGTMLGAVPNPEIQRDVTIFATVHSAIAWKHTAEPRTERMVCQWTVICPAEAVRLTQVLSARDPPAHPRQDRWEANVQIFADLESWHDNCQP